MISFGALEAGDGGIYWVANDHTTMYEQALLEGDQELVLMLEHRIMMHNGDPCSCSFLAQLADRRESHEVSRRYRASRRRPRR